MKKQQLIVLAGILLLTLLVLVVVNSCKPRQPERPARNIARIPVEVLAVQRREYTIMLPSQGLVKASTEASLAAQVAGTVVSKNANFDEGGSFRRGDVLLTIDDADYRAGVALAEASYNQAKVALQEEQARSEQAVRDWQRLGNGEAPGPLVARQPQLAAAKASVAAAAAQLAKARLDLSRTRIIAPYDGRVIGSSIDEGNYVTPGRTLAAIIDASRLKVNLPISAAWRHLLDWRDHSVTAELLLEVPGSKAAWQATIRRASANLDTNSRQFTLVAAIDLNSASRPDVDLFVGDYVQAQIQGKRLQQVVVLPRAAVYDNRYAWVVQQGALQKRPVNVVWSSATDAVINSGLNIGEQVVVTPLGSVVSGTKVRIVNNAASQPAQPAHNS